ncbi:MAG: aspartate aminotransferase family protein [Gammaproteobacteria bacterium]|nr:aspartate aminotransferase family protein [Gammaproteobacteria bacterium]
MAVRPNSNVARDVAYHIHPHTNFRQHEEQGSLVVTKGEGVYIYDEEGKKYIEAMAGLWCASLGFSEKRLADVAHKQMLELPYYHTFNYKTHAPVVDLAERLVEMAPAKMSKVIFQSSGSEANDTAVKFVHYYNNAVGRPEKKKIISRIKGYHGTTRTAASLTGLPNMHALFDLPVSGILHTDCPHHYRFGESGESETAFASRLAASLDAMIEAEGPDTVAAFIAEPVMGAGGVIVPPETYFEKIQAVLKKHDVLLIADEVICGFGRTGNMWGSQTMGMRPDILTCAKALSASYLPISGILISDAIYEGLKEGTAEMPFGHGFTYGGHPVAAAVALETLKIYEEMDLLARVRSVGPILQNGLREFADHPLVGEVRGVGMVAAVEMVEDKATHQSFDPSRKVGTALQDMAQQDGLIVRAAGDSIAFSPPLILNEAQAREIVEKFGQALDRTWRAVQSGRI